jgi:creatinine amidohydrolase
MLLAEMSWDEVEAYLKRDDRVVVPLGSTEQHGRRGPLGTDHIIPEGLAAALAERTGTVAAPALNYGVAEHHMAFPGTVSIRPRSWIGFVEDLLESLYRHGFRRMLVLNGHGGNSPALQCVFSELANRHLDLKLRLSMWWQEPGVQELEREMFGTQTICHASPGEISLAAFVRPATHKDKQVPAGVVRAADITYANREAMRRAYPDGVLGAGDQNLSDPARGEAIFERVLETLRPRLEDF